MARWNSNDIDLLSQAIGSSQSRFDMNSDGVVDDVDRDHWVTDVARTYYGDADLDGQFDSGDFVQVFQRGEYEDAVSLNSGWDDGDWNGDQEFDSGDFVLAFQSGGYESGRRTQVTTVPEPSPIGWALIGLLGLIRLRRRA